MRLRTGQIVGYDRVPGGCACRFEIVYGGHSQGGRDAKCVATCYHCDFMVGVIYHLHEDAIVFDPLADGLEERFGS